MSLNSLSPGKFQRNVRWVIFKLILVINGWVISCEIVLRWILLDHSSNGLVPSDQCWPRSMLPYGVTRPQWVNYRIKSVVGKLRNQLQGQIGWHWNTSQSHLCWGQGLWCAHQGCLSVSSYTDVQDIFPAFYLPTLVQYCCRVINSLVPGRYGSYFISIFCTF